MYLSKLRLFACSLGFLLNGTLSAQNVDLSRLPPSLSPPVDPNMVLSYDDSGSMGSNFMGDQRPFDPVFSLTSWSGPWRCAAVIDPTADPSSLVAETKARASVMNGVYYNPNVRYLPPTYPTATGIATLPDMNAANTANYTKVPVDGFAVGGWPVNPIAPNYGSQTVQAATHYGNPLQAYPDTSGSPVPTNASTDLVNTTTAPNKLWRCGTDVMISPSTGLSTFTTPNNDGGASQPFYQSSPVTGGGPYYYKLKTGVTILTAGKIDPAKLYVAANWEAVKVPAADLNNFANWYAYYRTRHLAARSSLSRAFIQVGAMGYKMRLAFQSFNATSALFSLPAANGYPSGTVRTDLPNTTKIFDFNGQQKTRFYEWLFLIPITTGATPARNTLIRAGEYFKTVSSADPIYGGPVDGPYWEPSLVPPRNLSCRKNYHMMVSDGAWNDSPDPAPAVNAAYDLGTLVLGGQIPSIGHPANRVYRSETTQSRTSLASYAFHYWATDLVPALNNNVPPTFTDRNGDVNAFLYNTKSVPVPMGVESNLPLLASNETNGGYPAMYYNPVNNPATWQHVVQFMVGMGVDGNLNYPDDYIALRKTGLYGGLNWTSVTGASTTRIDDTWHAAVNSRGQYFSVKAPQDLVDGVNSALLTVFSRQSTSSSAGISASVLIDNSAYAYTTEANVSMGWGNLKAKNINEATGLFIEPAVWEADALLTARTYTTRKIYTSRPDQGGLKVFTWANLSPKQQTWLDTNPDTDSLDGLGQQRLEFIRGDRSNETGVNPLFRSRPGLLGPAVRAVPVYNAGADSGYSDSMFPTGSPEQVAAANNSTSYANFVNTSKTRPATVYLAANDGMLHAFDATTGQERWAYIPYEVFRNLNSLTSKKFSYRPFVDSTPVITDIYQGGQWKTILVGGLGFGGKGIYALDITDPNNPQLMWEFSRETSTTRTSLNGQPTGLSLLDNRLRELGYTFGQPNTVYVKTGPNQYRWVVLVPSGYYANVATSPPQDMYDAYSGAVGSPSHSSLYVLDASDGSILKKIDTPISVPGQTGIASHGLTTTATGSYGGFAADFAVAGDLNGNLWRFDFTTDMTNWGAAGTVDLLFRTYAYSGGGYTGLGNQPITVQPMMFPDKATGRLMIIFGTGKLLGSSDQQGQAQQAIYSVREYGKNSTKYPISVGDLSLATPVDTTTTRGINHNPTEVGTKAGWYMTLNNTTNAWERVVIPASRMGNLAIITSTIVNASDRCNPQYSGYVMVFDPVTIQPSAPTVDTYASLIGVKISNPPVADSPALAANLNKNKVILPGIADPTGNQSIGIPDALTRRKSWRDLTQPPAQ